MYRIVENSEKEKERNVANVNRKNWRKEELKMKNGEEIEAKRERNVVEAKTGATVEDAEAKAGLAVAVEIDVGAGQYKPCILCRQQMLPLVVTKCLHTNYFIVIEIHASSRYDCKLFVDFHIPRYVL